MKNIRGFGICALIALGAISLAQDAVTLKATPKVGDKLTYNITGEMDVPGGSVNITGGQEIDKVTKVDADGNYTVESTTTGLTIGTPQGEQKQPDQTSTLTFKPSGDIVDISADEVTPDTWRLAEMNDFIYPDKPVKVGDTWTSTVAADDKKGIVAATATYKVDGMEKIGTHDTVKVTVNYKETTGANAVTNDSDVWIDTKDGNPVKVVSHFTNYPIMGMSIAGTVTLQRQD